jgi:hypothetical protein
MNSTERAYTTRRCALRAGEFALADHALEHLSQEIDRGIGVAGDCRSVLPDRGAGGKRQAAVGKP